MIQTGTISQVTVPIEQYNALLKQNQSLLIENTALKRGRAKDKQLLIDMAAEINKLKAELAEQLWQRRLSGVSASVCSSAKKKVLQAIYARYQEEPGETITVSRQYLANKSQIDADTVSYHLKDLEEQGLLTRQEGSGKQLEIRLEPRILANPSYIPKIVPPAPPRKKTPDIEKALEDQHCPNCGSPDVQLHILGDCHVCKEPFIVYLGYPQQESEETNGALLDCSGSAHLSSAPSECGSGSSANEGAQETDEKNSADARGSAQKPVIACYFCTKKNRRWSWFWNSEEGTYLCTKCYSSVEMSKHNYSLERMQE